MLHLLLGPDWSANRDKILSMIAQDVKSEKGGRILLVPELISHEAERQLCEAAGDTASRFAEVLSFSRLARRVAEDMQLGMEECLDGGGQVVAMAAANHQIHSQLKTYADMETRADFLIGMLDTVDEFKRCCIFPENLMSAAGKVEGSLSQKLLDLALIFQSYNAVCMQSKRDPRDMETLLLEQMELGDFASRHTFYIDGFPDFSRQHMDIVQYLIENAADVILSINCDTIPSKKLAFEKTSDTASQILRYVKEKGVNCLVEKVEPHRSALLPLRETLFQGQIEQGKLQGIVKTCQAESAYGECEAAAEQIMKMVRDGARYRDIMVVCADLSSYKPLLNLAFRRCGIPMYLSGNEDILQKSIISMVLSGMEAALEGFEQRSVMRYLRSALSPLEPDVCDLIENYAVLWGVRGNKWLTPWTGHPEGLSGIWTERAENELAKLNQAREQAMEPLRQLRDSFGRSKNIALKVDALCAFLEQLDLENRLEKLARQMDAACADSESALGDFDWRSGSAVRCAG